MPKSKKERIPSKVTITKNQRKGNKYVTIIAGLAANEIDLEVAKKFFAQRFACSCSKGEVDELVIQGDVVDSLFDVIPEKFPQVNLIATRVCLEFGLFLESDLIKKVFLIKKCIIS